VSAWGVAALPASHVAKYPFSGPLDGGKAFGGGVCSGKPLKPLLWPSLRVCVGCGAAGVALAVPLAKHFGLSACRVLGVLLFPTARLFGWLCLRAWLLVAALGSSPLDTVFCFSGGVLLRLALGRRWAVWGAAAQFLGNACLGLPLVFLLKISVI
jgi:hypothetical protein